jgi:type IV conjugative transfer system pilin TraA
VINSRLKILGNKYNTTRLSLCAALLILCGYFIFYSELSFAADQLAGVMDEVRSNFGKDSTAVKLLYGAEIIAGGYTWHKTKNPAAVTGVVVLSLFMNYALGKWIG